MLRYGACDWQTFFDQDKNYDIDCKLLVAFNDSIKNMFGRPNVKQELDILGRSNFKLLGS